MRKGKLIGKIFGIAIILLLIGATLATALPLGALGKNRVSAQEGVSYIIVHALNPEGIEIASIEQVGQNSVGIYDGDTFIGYGAHDAASYNQPITINGGGHVIKVIFNGIILEQNINLNPNETQTLVFTFKRTSANILSYFDFNESNSITQETDIAPYTGYWAVASSSPVYMHNNTHASSGWVDSVILRQEVHATETITPSFLTVLGSASSSIITEDGVLDHLELAAGGTIHKTISIPSQGFNTWWIQNHVTAPSDGRASDVWCTLSTGAWWFDLIDWYETGYITKTASATYEYTDIGFCPFRRPVEEETSGYGKFLTVSGSGTYYIAGNELKMSSVPYDLTGTGIKYEEVQPPVASFTYDPENPVVGEEITFDASSSYDPDGEIVSYGWDLDASDGIQVDAEGELVTHTYAEAGDYTIRLTVTDNDGLTDSTQQTVKVQEVQPPVASFTYSPENPVVDEPVNFDATSSYDPDGAIDSYYWNFGDGSASTANNPSHVYSNPGTYTIRLTITDNHRLTDSAQLMLEVKPVPVLLVHGYYSSPAMWEPMIQFLENNGYEYEKNLFTVDLAPGPAPANGDIRAYARRLSDEIAYVKSTTGATKVDLICHSMGGLVSRWYTTHGYRNDVRKLIMIGTPNHGSELLHLHYASWLLPLIFGIGVEVGIGIAGDQMTPNSAFLNTLNYGAWYRPSGTDLTNPAIHHEVIAGTDDWWFTNLILWGDNDRVVRVESARLDGVNLDKVFYDHFDECHVTEVFDKVLTTLQDDPPESPQSPESMPAQQDPPTVQQAPMVSDRIYPGEQKLHGIPISATLEATFALVWDGSDLNLILTTPSGTLIDPAVAEVDPNISYYHDDNTTIKGYTVQNPEPGIWQVNVAAVDVPDEGEDYTVMTFLNTTVILSLSLAKYQYDPGEGIDISAELESGGIPISGASVLSEIQRPDESVESLILYDDGLHNDNEANDGIYANICTNTSESGTYDITVSATGAVDGEDFARQAFTTVWVERYPDLALTSSDIHFSNDMPIAGENITINATIHNIGDSEANNASILFYDGEPANGELIGEDTISVGADQTAEAPISWNATAGEHEIYVLISPFNEFLEKDYTNNIASKIIDVTQISGCYIGAYLGCGSGDLSCESISDFNQEMGKNHAIFVRYVDVADSEDPAHFAWAQEVKNNGAMPMFIYDPWGGLDAMNMTDVEYFASRCNELNMTIFIVFGHEMNGPWYPWGNAPDNYTSKFKEVAEIFHENAPNVEMCWVPNQNWGYPWGGTDYGDGYSEYYPEGTGTYGEYVDWVGLNFYEKDWDEDNLVPPDMFVANIRSGQDSADFYEMFAVGKNKPMLIAEMGAFDPNKDPTGAGERNPLNEAEQAEFKNEWIEQVYDASTLKNQFPGLNAICYFHVSKTETIDTQSHSFYDITADYRIPETPNVYENLISDPYFIGAEANSPPNTPSNPSPTNHATAVSIDADLSWTGGDPDAGDTVTYDVYFGTSSPPPFQETIGPYAATQSSIIYNPGTLVDGTTYCWQIVARDNHGITAGGSIWDFTTGKTGDVNNDDHVNVLDMILIGQYWGQTGSPGWIPEDVKKDGAINVLDMIIIGQHWTG